MTDITVRMSWDVRECFANPRPGGPTLYGISGRSAASNRFAAEYLRENIRDMKYVPHLDAWIEGLT